MKQKIIIVDDHKIFGEGLCSLLEENNFIVKRVFQDPKLALNYLKNNNAIDIVFTDINIPKIKEYITELKKNFDIDESNIISSLLYSGRILGADLNLNKNDKKGIKKMLNNCIDDVNRYRIMEGKAISKDLKKSILKLESSIKKINLIESLRINEKKIKLKVT